MSNIEWFAREGWLWALAAIGLVALCFVVLALTLSAPDDDDDWGSGSF